MPKSQECENLLSDLQTAIQKEAKPDELLQIQTDLVKVCKTKRAKAGKTTMYDGYDFKRFRIEKCKAAELGTKGLKEWRTECLKRWDEFKKAHEKTVAKK